MGRTTVLLTALLMSSALSAADDAADGTRSPGDMSPEQRVAMMRTANEYNSCVYGEALEHIDADEDIRRIADMAMGACQGHLDGLGETIIAWGYPDYFATRFTHNVRDRAARKLLPELAIRKSN